ncbi:hypothetical protein PR048_028576 [Dryococelus australis]|uniref:Uncharacterized protein n=1 Tax=Dryococelus australis TaxID=614101 RepID=A0ABQ9GAZ1_9NEOP|nr:hypothetical protein PR048_028576 [Dryococelus australis]
MLQVELVGAVRGAVELMRSTLTRLAVAVSHEDPSHPELQMLEDAMKVLLMQAEKLASTYLGESVRSLDELDPKNRQQDDQLLLLQRVKARHVMHRVRNMLVVQMRDEVKELHRRLAIFQDGCHTLVELEKADREQIAAQESPPDSVVLGQTSIRVFSDCSHIAKMNCEYEGLPVTSTIMELRPASSLTGLRCIIITGSSHCGKTTEPAGRTEWPFWFENVYVYSKSLQSPKYQRLVDNEAVVPPSEALSNSIFVFDDIACEKQTCIQEYLCMGRHMHVDCMYFGQTYSRITIQMLYDNANMFVLFRMDDPNLQKAQAWVRSVHRCLLRWFVYSAPASVISPIPRYTSMGTVSADDYDQIFKAKYGMIKSVCEECTLARRSHEIEKLQNKRVSALNTDEHTADATEKSNLCIEGEAGSEANHEDSIIGDYDDSDSVEDDDALYILSRFTNEFPRKSDGKKAEYIEYSDYKFTEDLNNIVHRLRYLLDKQQCGDYSTMKEVQRMDEHIAAHKEYTALVHHDLKHNGSEFRRFISRLEHALSMLENKFEDLEERAKDWAIYRTYEIFLNECKQVFAAAIAGMECAPTADIRRSPALQKAVRDGMNVAAVSLLLHLHGRITGSLVCGPETELVDVEARIGDLEHKIVLHHDEVKLQADNLRLSVIDTKKSNDMLKVKLQTCHNHIQELQQLMDHREKHSEVLSEDSP